MDDVSDNSDESWASESEYDTDGSGEIWETESENEIIGEDSDDRYVLISLCLNMGITLKCVSFLLAVSVESSFST